MRASATLLLLLLSLACTSMREARLRSAVEAVMMRVDPQRQAVVLASDEDLARVRSLVANDRSVVALSQFEAEHPGEAVPYNILLGSVETRGDAVLVRVHVQAVSHPPPGTLFCGTGYVFEVTRPNREWVIRELEATVC